MQKMWNMISDLMIELELPILKARSRDEYAMEQEMSPWSIGMLSDKENFKNTKQQHFIRISTQYTGAFVQHRRYGNERRYRQAFCIQRRKSHLLRRIPLYVGK